MEKSKRFTKKEWSWIMYDWANSIYATNIMAAIYPTIFASAVPNGDIRWGYATSAATLIVALLSPVLGALADYKGYKKKLFTLFMLIGVLFTPLMVLTGHWKLCLVGYVLSHIGFNGSCLFYDSFLTDVTTNERMDRVSSWGYAMGYIGGSTIPFVISIGMLLLFDYNAFAQAFSVLIVSVWWLVFSIPMLKNVTHEHYRDQSTALNIKNIFSSILTTLRRICKSKGLLIFILAYFCYIDGVDTIISISTAYGTTLGLGTTGMILALLVTQIVAVPCSIWFAKLSEAFSARKMLIGAVAIYLAICLLGFYMGFSMEPSQNAYEKVFDETYASMQIDADLKKDAKALLENCKDAWKSDDPVTALAEAYDIELDKKDAKELLENSIDAWKSDDPVTALAEAYGIGPAENSDKEKVSALLNITLGADLLPVKEALFAAAEGSMDKMTAFRDAISFSTLLFWIMATMVGTVQGGIQAVSRSYFGKIIPKEHSNEYYGFFDIFGKFASFLGPVIYSTCAAVTGRSSIGVLGLAALFLAGLCLLLFGRKSFAALEQQKI